jgi:hypothetical protein
MRDALSADLVALLVEAGPEWVGGVLVPPQHCGIGSQGARALGLMDPSVGGSQAFSITDVSCSATDLTFTHEIGHNLGGIHGVGLDPLDLSVAGTPFDHQISAATRHSLGFTHTADWFQFRTIMGSGTLVGSGDVCGRDGDPNGCPRVNRWSSPNQLLNLYGLVIRPLGAATGLCVPPAAANTTPCSPAHAMQYTDMVASHAFAMPHVAAYRGGAGLAPLAPQVWGWWRNCVVRSAINLGWGPSVQGGAPPDYYQVEQSTVPSFAWWLTTPVYHGPGTSHTQAVSANSWFRVRACNAVGCSDWSNFDPVYVPLPPC